MMAHDASLSLPAAIALRTRPVQFWRTGQAPLVVEAQDLRTRAAVAALQLRGAGLRSGDVVGLALPACLELVVLVTAVWLCGAAVLVLPVGANEAGMRDPRHRPQEWLERLGVHWLFHEDEDEAWNEVSARKWRASELRNWGCAPSEEAAANLWTLGLVSLEGLALLQLTSGSTGVPKGVSITHRMLSTNCAAITQRADVIAEDHMVTWLPLNHDLGFSALAVALSNDADVTLIRTGDFVKAPPVWLEALSRQRGTVSPCPAFACVAIARLDRRLARLSLDLSSWRFAWIGAEPIFDHHLRAFAQVLAPFGLRATTLQPSYGMAEAVVGVCFGSPGSAYAVIDIDSMKWHEHGEIRLMHEAGPDSLRLVSNGTPLPGVQVKAVDEGGNILPELCQGELLVRGPSVTSGYRCGEEPERFAHGWFHTGDLGFLHQGEIYVSGRMKDLVIRGGVKVGARQIEAVIEDRLGVRSTQVAAFSCLDHSRQREALILLVAKRFGAEEDTLRVQLAAEVVQRLGIQMDHIHFVAANDLPKTTSGKLQRALLRQWWQQRLNPAISPLKEDEREISV